MRKLPIQTYDDFKLYAKICLYIKLNEETDDWHDFVSDIISANHITDIGAIEYLTGDYNNAEICLLLGYVDGHIVNFDLSMCEITKDENDKYHLHNVSQNSIIYYHCSGLLDSEYPVVTMDVEAQYLSPGETIGFDEDYFVTYRFGNCITTNEIYENYIINDDFEYIDNLVYEKTGYHIEENSNLYDLIYQSGNRLFNNGWYYIVFIFNDSEPTRLYFTVGQYYTDYYSIDKIDSSTYLTLHTHESAPTINWNTGSGAQTYYSELDEHNNFSEYTYLDDPVNHSPMRICLSDSDEGTYEIFSNIVHVFPDETPYEVMETFEEVDDLVYENTGYRISSSNMRSIINYYIESGTNLQFAFLNGTDKTSKFLYMFIAVGLDGTPNSNYKIMPGDISIVKSDQTYSGYIYAWYNNQYYILHNYYLVLSNSSSESAESEWGRFSYSFWQNYPSYLQIGSNRGDPLNDDIDYITFSTLLTPPTMEEAVEELNDLFSDMADAIKETFSIPEYDLSGLNEFLDTYPCAYTPSSYDGYYYTDQAREKIINKCIELFNEPYSSFYYQYGAVIYYTEGYDQTWAEHICIIWIGKETKYSRYDSPTTTQFNPCFKLNFNSSSHTISVTTYSNIDLPYTNIKVKEYLLNTLSPTTQLIKRNKSTINPREFAKIIRGGTGSLSNQYSYKSVFKDVANAIRSLTGSTALIKASDMPETILNIPYRDLISETNKNMNNWTVTGNVTITYADGENVVEYQNEGSSDVDRMTADFISKFGITPNATLMQNICNFWEQNHTTYPYLILRRLSSDTAYDGGVMFMQNQAGTNSYPQWVVSGTMTYSNQDLYGPGCYCRAFWNQTDLQLIGPKTHNTTYQQAETIYYKYNEFHMDPISFTGDAQLSVSVENGKTYRVEFDACSPSGFNADTNQITVTSGSNVVSETFDNTQTSTYSDYDIQFTADGSTAVIKFDFSKMVNSSDIELNIKDISMYEQHP